MDPSTQTSKTDTNTAFQYRPYNMDPQNRSQDIQHKFSQQRSPTWTPNTDLNNTDLPTRSLQQGPLLTWTPNTGPQHRPPPREKTEAQRGIRNPFGCPTCMGAAAQGHGTPKELGDRDGHEHIITLVWPLMGLRTIQRSCGGRGPASRHGTEC